MIIIGAKGFAIEILQILAVDMDLANKDIVFFDNISTNLPEVIFNEFKILKSFEEVKTYLEHSNDKNFVLGLGNPKHRQQLFEKFVALGAKPLSVFSSSAEVGSFNVSINTGVSVMSGARISNNVTIGKGSLIYYNTVITHDCTIGNFCEISPNVNVLGRCKIGDSTSIGAGATVLPDVVIGNNVIVGAGTVVLNNVPNNCTIVGVPGKIVKAL